MSDSEPQSASAVLTEPLGRDPVKRVRVLTVLLVTILIVEIAWLISLGYGALWFMSWLWA